jgi:hypothetical protein
MSLWNRKEIPSVEEAWYEAVSDFYAYEGAQIHTEEIYLLEQMVIDKGLSEDYIQTLKTMISNAPEDEEVDHFVLLLSATPAEREKALRFVLYR